VALDWKVFTSFSAKDLISGAVKSAQKNTERAAKGMGDAMGEAGKEADGLRDKIAGAGKEADGLLGKAGGIGMGKIAGGVAIGNLVAKGITSAAAVFKNVIESIPEFVSHADEIGKTAQKLGLTTDALQRYRYAAAHANVENATLNTAFQTMTKGIGSGSLFKSLGKLDAGLAAQVKQARTVDGAFRTIATAASKYTDVGQRTAVLMAAFGKAGNQLVPMLGDLNEQLGAAGKYGNIISPNSIAMAAKFNDTMTDVKLMIQSFGDVVRGAVVQHVAPLINQFREWAAVNREVIAAKIQEFVKKAANFITWLVKAAVNLYKIIVKFGPAIAGAVIGFKAFNTATAAISGAKLAMEGLAAITAGAGGIAAAGTKAFTGLASAIFASKIAMAGLVGLAAGGAIAIYGVLKKNQQELADKEGVSYKGWGDAHDRALMNVERRQMDRAAALAREDYDYLKNNPELTYKKQMEVELNAVRASEVADSMKKEDAEARAAAKETNDLLKELLKGQGEEIGAINGLADKGSRSNPARLRWGAMGVDDYWETARLGV